MKLKNVLSILAICFSFAFSGIAQEDYVVSQNLKKLSMANESGTYTFTLPNEVTREDVELSAEFYTVYFSVDFNEKTHQVVIKLQGNEEKNRNVISRFFISLGLRQIMMEDELYEIQEYYDKYLKQVKTEK